MFKRSLFFGVLAIAVLSLGVAPSFGQVGAVSGTVAVDRDGKSTPAVGVLVEVFRTDTNSGGPTTKTDKNGRFVFAGIPAGATVVLIFSAPELAPTYAPGIKAGTEGLKIAMSPGDGRRLTEAEARSLAAGTAGGVMSEADKKRLAEEEAKLKAIEASNKKIEESTAVVKRSLEEGNAAFGTKNYDIAIVKYDEGINASPDFVGTAPVLLNNKGLSLRARAIANYNANVKNTDAKARQDANIQVRKDFADSLESFHRSYTLLKAATPGEVPEASIKDQISRALSGGHDTLKVAAQTEQVDAEKMAMAKTLLEAYAETEPDATKKAGIKIVLGDLYRVAGDSDNAILVYKEVLASNPDNADAMAGAGISLVNSGYITENKAQLQEGADMLQKYSEIAPAGHKYLDDAKGLIETLKAESNIAPQRTTRPARRRN
jgi:tetratricopeptide (TPR) repeat protein